MQKQQKCLEHHFFKKRENSFWANLGPLMTHKIVHVKSLHVNFSVGSDNSLKNYTTTISWKIIEVFAEKHTNEKKIFQTFIYAIFQQGNDQKKSSDLEFPVKKMVCCFQVLLEVFKGWPCESQRSSYNKTSLI